MQKIGFNKHKIDIWTLHFSISLSHSHKALELCQSCSGHSRKCHRTHEMLIPAYKTMTLHILPHFFLISRLFFVSFSDVIALSINAQFINPFTAINSISYIKKIISLSRHCHASTDKTFLASFFSYSWELFFVIVVVVFAD
jgi:hypothetical protein